MFGDDSSIDELQRMEAQGTHAPIQTNTLSSEVQKQPPVVFSIPSSIPAVVKITMVSHLCNIVEEVRGTRPSPKTVLATLGIDSLNSVILVRQISESLGGIRVRPATIFKPGLTIRQLAIELTGRLQNENPSILQQLGIYSAESRDVSRENSGHGSIGATWKVAKAKENSNTEISEYSGQNITTDELTEDESPDSYTPSKLEASFDVMIGRLFTTIQFYFNLLRIFLIVPRTCEISFDAHSGNNVEIFEGMRGLFAFMVLWDHYHGSISTNSGIVVDTTLFFILSGVSTALQMRTVPQYLVETAVVESPRVDTEMAGGDGERIFNKTKYLLQPRPVFDVFSFLTLRFVGLFPLLWLAIIIITPQVLNLSGDQEQQMKNCLPYFVSGMQSWVKSCNGETPYDEWYVSVLINIFIVYAALRLLLSFTLDSLMSLRRKDFVLPYSSISSLAQAIDSTYNRSEDEMQETLTETESLSALENLGAVATMIAYNRVGVIGALFLTSFWFACMLIIFYFVCEHYRYFGDETVIDNITYFLAGVSLVSVTESWHYALNRVSAHVDVEDAASALANNDIDGTVRYLDANEVSGVKEASHRAIVEEPIDELTALLTITMGKKSKLSDEEEGKEEAADALPNEYRASSYTCCTCCYSCFCSVCCCCCRPCSSFLDFCTCFGDFFQVQKYIPTLPCPPAFTSNGKKACSSSSDRSSASDSEGSAHRSPNHHPADTDEEVQAANHVETSQRNALLDCCGRFSSIVLFYLWCFLPDMLAVSFGLLLSTYGDLNDKDVWIANRWIWLPLIYLAFMFVILLQRDTECNNFSRYFLETPPLRALGYCSLPIFLFQHVLIEYYAPVIVISLQSGTFDYEGKIPDSENIVAPFNPYGPTSNGGTPSRLPSLYSLLSNIVNILGGICDLFLGSKATSFSDNHISDSNPIPSDRDSDLHVNSIDFHHFNESDPWDIIHMHHSENFTQKIIANFSSALSGSTVSNIDGETVAFGPPLPVHVIHDEMPAVWFVNLPVWQRLCIMLCVIAFAYAVQYLFQVRVLVSLTHSLTNSLTQSHIHTHINTQPRIHIHTYIHTQIIKHALLYY